MEAKIKDWWNGLPTWGKWGLALGVVAVLVYVYIRHRESTISGTLPIPGGVPSGTPLTGGTPTSSDMGAPVGSTGMTSDELTQLGKSITSLATQEQNSIGALEQGLAETNSGLANALQGIEQNQNASLSAMQKSQAKSFSSLSAALASMQSSIAQGQSQSQQSLAQAITGLEEGQSQNYKSLTQTISGMEKQIITLRNLTAGATSASGAATAGTAISGTENYPYGLIASLTQVQPWASQEVSNINAGIQQAGGSGLSQYDQSLDVAAEQIQAGGYTNTQAGQQALSQIAQSIQQQNVVNYNENQQAVQSTVTNPDNYYASSPSQAATLEQEYPGFIF